MVERTFSVMVIRYGLKALVYPDQTGEKALASMSRLKARGFDTVARTSANGVTEDLTLAEMADLYEAESVAGDSVPAMRERG
jgi:hypothetical protein